MVKSKPSKKVSFLGPRKVFRALEPPPEVLVSESSVPDAEIYGIARTRTAFDAIRRAAQGIGLEMGVPRRPARKQVFFAWGEEAEQAIDAALEREPAQPPPYEDGAWPYWFVVWSDPSRTTFLVVIADPDRNYPKEIIAWGPNAQRCLAVAEEAIDDDELWKEPPRPWNF